MFFKHNTIDNVLLSPAQSSTQDDWSLSAGNFEKRIVRIWVFGAYLSACRTYQYRSDFYENTHVHQAPSTAHAHTNTVRMTRIVFFLFAFIPFAEIIIIHCIGRMAFPFLLLMALQPERNDDGACVVKIYTSQYLIVSLPSSLLNVFLLPLAHPHTRMYVLHIAIISNDHSRWSFRKK